MKKIARVLYTFQRDWKKHHYHTWTDANYVYMPVKLTVYDVYMRAFTNRAQTAHKLFSLSISSPIAEWQCGMTWIKLRLCLHGRSVLWFTTIQRPIVFAVQPPWSYRRNCLYHDAWKRWSDRWENSPRMLTRRWLKGRTWKLASEVFCLWLIESWNMMTDT